MRTIKFRGKKQNDEWVYGSLLSFNGVNDSIYYQVKKGREERIEYAYVHPRTVGQFTGLLDKNGKEIYEDYFRKIYIWMIMQIRIIILQ